MVSPGVVIVYHEPGMVEPGAVGLFSTTPSLAAVNLTKDPDTQSLHCARGALLGPLGLFVQFLLAFIAFTSLIAKRFCEPKPERRSWKVWFFDTSKQGVGAAVIHFANVFLAGMFHGDPCTWYIVSFLLDSTVGLVVIYIGLQISQCIAAKKGYDNLILGEYGNPPRCHAWVVQCGLYIIVMLIEKFLMTLLVLFDFWKEVRKLILSPIKDPNLELIFTMFVVPFIVNAIIFWVVDNFLKKKQWKSIHTSVHAPESSGGMKYFKSGSKVKYYKKTNNEDNSESDTLLSFDEDSVTESNGHIPKPENSPNCDSSEEYRLL